MRHWTTLSFGLAFGLASGLTLLSGCSSSPTRKIASSESAAIPGEATISLAKKLTGGKIRFAAKRQDGRKSILQFLLIEFKDCSAEVSNFEVDGVTPVPESSREFVLCESDFQAGPFKGRVKAKIHGAQKEFNVHFSEQEKGHYSVEASANMKWSFDHSRWQGTGKVSGWYHGGKSDDGITVTLQEDLEL